MRDTTISIALTNLGQYNEGQLNYTWVELPVTDQELKEHLESIGVDGVRYEEYFISDYDCELKNLVIGEYSNLKLLNEIAWALEDLVDPELRAFDLLLSYLGCEDNYEDALEALNSKMEDIIVYEVDSLGDFGETWSNEVYGDVPEWLSRYVDWERFGQDLIDEMDCEYDDEYGIVVIFRT